MHLLRQTRIHGIMYFIVTAVFLSVLFGSLFHMPADTHMSGETAGCVFMTQGETLCPMSTLDHLTAWKTAFTTLIPPFALIFFAIVAISAVCTMSLKVLLRQRSKIRRLSREVRERVYAFSYRPLQELFSNGILHPKLF